MSADAPDPATRIRDVAATAGVMMPSEGEVASLAATLRGFARGVAGADHAYAAGYLASAVADLFEMLACHDGSDALAAHEVTQTLRRAAAVVLARGEVTR